MARYALPQICLVSLAQLPFPSAVVGQKDCATTAFRYRFAAAAPCHGSSFPLYRRNLERISPFRHVAPVRTVIPSQPADWHRNPIPSPRTAIVLSFRASPQAGVGIRLPVPRAAGADTLSLRANPRCCCHSEPVLTLAWESVPPILLRRATRRTYLLRCFAPQKARFDNRHTPQGESFQRERARTPFPFGRFKGIGFLREGGNSESPFP